MKTEEITDKIKNLVDDLVARLDELENDVDRITELEADKEEG